MKNTTKLLVGTGVAATCLLTMAVGALAGSGLAAVAPKLAKAPAIDGVIQAGEYPDAGKVSYADASGASSVKVTFWTAWDDTNLYFAANVQDNDVVGDQTGTGAPVWGDDDVEIYLDAANAGEAVRGATDYQYLWGAMGGTNQVIGDGAGGYDFTTWQPALKSVTKVLGTINNGADTDKGYVVEAAFPLKDLDMKARAGLKVGFNVTSFDYASDPRTALVSFFSWQPDVDISNNHVPTGWGTLTLK